MNAYINNMNAHSGVLETLGRLRFMNLQERNDSSCESMGHMPLSRLSH